MYHSFYIGGLADFPKKVIGRHKCVSCGEFFGIDTDDEIEKCQEERYQEYLKTQYLFPGILPCFFMFDKEYLNNNKELMCYLKEHRLKFNNHNKYRHCSNWEELKKEALTKDTVQSFNRPLTKDEWVKLNNCKCELCPCFSLNYIYRKFIELYEDYKKAGFDVKLEYNCPKCCKKGKSEFEFWFRFRSEDEYVISIPEYWGTDKGVHEYGRVLEFLDGCHSHNDVLCKLQKRGYYRENSEFDKVLNNIIGESGEYTKKDIHNHAVVFWSMNKNNKLEFSNEIWECAEEILFSVLSLYENSYKFSLSEYCELMVRLDELWDIKITANELIPVIKEVVQKRIIYNIKNIDNTIDKTSVYKYLEGKFPNHNRFGWWSAHDTNLCDFTGYMSNSLQGYPGSDQSYKYRYKDIDVYCIVFKIIDTFYDLYGEDYKISISLLARFLNLFSELKVRLEKSNAEEIKEVIQMKNYIKNFIDGNMDNVNNLLSEYICDFVDKRNSPYVVNDAIPIVWFGDMDKYWASDKKILTLGLNPSEREFITTKKKWESHTVLIEDEKFRFVEVDQYYLSNSADRFLEGLHYCFCDKNFYDSDLYKLKQSLNDYFRNNPYEWFKKNNKLISSLDCSYGCESWDSKIEYPNTAIHIDIYSAIATTPTWGKLSKTQKEELKNLHLSRKLLDTLNPDIILSSVNKEVINEMFSEWELFAEYKFKGNNYIRAYKHNNQILINGTNCRGIPFGGIKEEEVKETILNILNSGN